MIIIMPTSYKKDKIFYNHPRANQKDKDLYFSVKREHNVVKTRNDRIKSMFINYTIYKNEYHYEIHGDYNSLTDKRYHKAIIDKQFCDKYIKHPVSKLTIYRAQEITYIPPTVKILSIRSPMANELVNIDINILPKTLVSLTVKASEPEEYNFKTSDFRHFKDLKIFNIETNSPFEKMVKFPKSIEYIDMSGTVYKNNMKEMEKLNPYTLPNLKSLDLRETCEYKDTGLPKKLAEYKNEYPRRILFSKSACRTRK